ncbi:MAG: Hsp20/alpha crystallin family protein [Bacteroidetes bacterium]|nr:Hsp20/alpha crystallin family protein [Bacteroidota bacterium]
MKTVNRKALWFPNLLEDLFFDSKLDFPSFSERFSVPAVNVLENSDMFVLEVAAPGLKKEDFTIEVEKDTLVIGAKSMSETVTHSDNDKDTEKTPENQYTRKEFSYSNFRRSFRLPEIVDTENIKANYTDGVLKINLPKVEDKVSKRMVEIS